MTHDRVAGSALLVCAGAFAVAVVLEGVRRDLGGDADDARRSVEFLSEHARVYVLTGTAFMVMALALIVGVVGAHESVRLSVDRTLARSVTVVGTVGAAFLLMNGALHVSPPGTVGYLDQLDPDWAESGYLAVHLVGTQGFFLAGMLCLATWAVALATLGARDRVVPRWLTWLGILPAAFLVAAIAGPLGGGGPDALFVVYLGAICGAALWAGCLGVALCVTAAEPVASSGVAPRRW